VSFGKDDSLDAMLAAPLPAVADNGFSQRIASRAAAMERRYWALDAAIVLAVLAFVFAFVPLTGVLRTLEVLAFGIATSVPLAIACAALVLSQSVARFLSE
jgi:hypothetical protein